METNETTTSITVAQYIAQRVDDNIAWYRKKIRRNRNYAFISDGIQVIFFGYFVPLISSLGLTNGYNLVAIGLIFLILLFTGLSKFRSKPVNIISRLVQVMSAGLLPAFISYGNSLNITLQIITYIVSFSFICSYLISQIYKFHIFLKIYQQYVNQLEREKFLFISRIPVKDGYAADIFRDFVFNIEGILSSEIEDELENLSFKDKNYPMAPNPTESNAPNYGGGLPGEMD